MDIAPLRVRGDQGGTTPETVPHHSTLRCADDPRQLRQLRIFGHRPPLEVGTGSAVPKRGSARARDSVEAETHAISLRPERGEREVLRFLAKELRPPSRVDDAGEKLREGGRGRLG